MMRLALAALVFMSPAEAAERRCTAHVHKGAVPWDVDFDTGAARPAEYSRDFRQPSALDLEVAGVRRDASGQLWVERAYEFTWRHADVDMKGDCRRALAFGRL